MDKVLPFPLINILTTVNTTFTHQQNIETIYSWTFSSVSCSAQLVSLSLPLRWVFLFHPIFSRSKYFKLISVNAFHFRNLSWIDQLELIKLFRIFFFSFHFSIAFTRKWAEKVFLYGSVCVCVLFAVCIKYNLVKCNSFVDADCFFIAFKLSFYFPVASLSSHRWMMAPTTSSSSSKINFVT